MSLHLHTTKTHRSLTDDFSGRAVEEDRCTDCGEWVGSDDTLWLLPDGTPSREHGQPYCEDCAPSDDAEEDGSCA